MEATSSRGRVLSVGRMYCDLIFTGLDKLPTLGEEHFAQGLQMHAGGGAYITAAYLAALGRPATLLSNLPAEPFGALVSKQLDLSRVDVTHCRPIGDATDPQVTIAMTLAAERAFVTRRSGAALPVSDIDWHQFVDLKHLHIGELTTLLEYPWLIANAQAAGLSVSLDCGWDDAALSRPDIAAQVAAVDVFLPNEAEFERLLQHGLDALAMSLCVVKRGAAGAQAHCADKRLINSLAKCVEVLDTTGAGDAFNAGFLDAWLLGQPLEMCLKAGNVCGSLAVGRVGGAADLVDIEPVYVHTRHQAERLHSL